MARCLACGKEFPQKYTGNFNYNEFFTRFKRACKDQDPNSKVRRAMISELNCYTWSIPIEEAAMQMAVYRLMHMHLEIGEDLFFDISCDSENNVKSDEYKKHYRLTQIFATPQYGPAVLFSPCDDVGSRLIFSRGTLAIRDADVIAKPTWPHGARDDLDPKGVGYPTIEWLKPQIVSISEECRQKKERLKLIGHSRGSAIVYGLLAALDRETRAHVDVLAFCPPGIPNKKICRAIYDDRNRITYTRHKWDLINFFGESLPAGKRIFTRDLADVSVALQAPHAVPQMAIRSLQNSEQKIIKRWRSKTILKSGNGSGY